MKVPISWLKDFVEITVPLEELARRLTMAGLEVEEIRYVGLPLPGSSKGIGSGGHLEPETKISGIEWDPKKIVVAQLLEVMPHPDADRLVLCRLDDGTQEHIVLTGAPNLFQYKGKGPLLKPFKVPYAKEGARIYDGHKPGKELTTLKRAKIRGIESYSMICSEKELGISDDHEGIIILDDEAPVSIPLVNYMGDAVFDIAITPNIARDANILGVAREVAAITRVPLLPPSYNFLAEGSPIKGQVKIEISKPELNPRFVLGLIKGIEIRPSPYWVQRRLHLAGMRPINNIVDATNYAMLEVGEPLHAFDYDILVQRAGGGSPVIHTRSARKGEKLTTLDGVERTLDDFTVLVCDEAGPLALAGVMGGAESEVNQDTRNVLLEGASWNPINTQRTVLAQRLPSEASYRFARNVHPAMAERGVGRGLELMRLWSSGVVAQGLVDNYPLPPTSSSVEITPQDVTRWLGIVLPPETICEILEALEFSVHIVSDRLLVTAPDHRLDIGQDIIGIADLMEEIARIYGYQNIPETRIADELPPQIGNPVLETEERIRDLLVNLGMQEIVTYRITSAQREARTLPPGIVNEGDYVKLLNPIVTDRNVLRRNLLPGLLEIVERNRETHKRQALFEIGPVFYPSQDGDLPEERSSLVIGLTGSREFPFWDGADLTSLDFYDLKGILNGLFSGLHIGPVAYQPGDYPIFHPGINAELKTGDQTLGMAGELHPLVLEQYDLPRTPMLAAILDLPTLMQVIPTRHEIVSIPTYPPVLEDLAIVVDDSVSAAEIEALIYQAGGKILVNLQLFDVYHGDQVTEGQKSLAYSLTYQAPDRTLTDEEISRIRNKIIKILRQELGAELRS